MLAKLQILDDNYRALFIPKNDNFKLRPRKKTSLYSVNNYFNHETTISKPSKQIMTSNLFLMSTKQWHICPHNFFKSADQCSQAMTEAAKKPF